jgi:hypothetical protein
VDIRALRIRANREFADLGAEPVDRRSHVAWRAQRRSTVILLAELADNDPELLRKAASVEWVQPGARDLLFSAIDQCRAA